MTSQRKLKKRAQARGMTGAEFKLAGLLEEVLADLRWMQILAYSNQYLLSHKLDVSAEERDQILEASTRAVDKDSKLHEWHARLGRLKSELANIQKRVGDARVEEDAGPAGEVGSDGAAGSDDRARPGGGAADDVRPDDGEPGERAAAAE